LKNNLANEFGRGFILQIPDFIHHRSRLFTPRTYRHDRVDEPHCEITISEVLDMLIVLAFTAGIESGNL
jgi:hypothetical protein